MGGTRAATWVGINPWVKRAEGEQALPRPQSSSSCLSPYTAAVSQSPTPSPGRSRLSSGSQAGCSGQRAHTDLRVASHVVHVESQEVAEPMRHEHGSQVDLDHGVHAAGQEADAGQLLQVDAVGQAVHVGPPDTWGSEGGCDEWRPLAAWPGLPRARLWGTQEALALAEAGEPEVRGKNDAAQVVPLQGSLSAALDSRPLLSLHCALGAGLLSSTVTRRGPAPVVCSQGQGSPVKSLAPGEEKHVSPGAEVGRPR